MPSTAESPASSRRCTDVVKIVRATYMDVAIKGDDCALYLYSPFGTTKVLLHTRDFIAAARGPRDCNRHPFPEIPNAQRDTMRVLAEDAQTSFAEVVASPAVFRPLPPAAPLTDGVSPPVRGSEPSVPVYDPLPPTQASQHRLVYRKIVTAYLADSSPGWSALARQHGVKTCNFRSWLWEQMNHVKSPVAEILELKARRAAARQPMLKPNGEIL